MNARQRQVYEALKASPPTSRLTGWGGAFFRGFDNPTMLVNNAGPIVGHPGSEARAAFLAGQCAARHRPIATGRLAGRA